jgi:hypothetical protein
LAQENVAPPQKGAGALTEGRFGSKRWAQRNTEAPRGFIGLNILLPRKPLAPRRTKTKQQSFGPRRPDGLDTCLSLKKLARMFRLKPVRFFVRGCPARHTSARCASARRVAAGQAARVPLTSAAAAPLGGAPCGSAPHSGAHSPSRSCRIQWPPAQTSACQCGCCAMTSWPDAPDAQGIR